MLVAEKSNLWLSKDQKNLKQSQYAYLAKFTEKSKIRSKPRFDWNYQEDKRRIRDENNCGNLLLFRSVKSPKYEPVTRSQYSSLSRQVDIEATFTDLVTQWLEETRGMSSTNQMSMHPAYQQIIGLGKAVIPLLLKELEKKSGHWFWALKSITREDPVPPEDRGKINKMIKAWIEWGRDKGYRW
ncbi:MAG: hypothetical protein RMY34_01675 [Aulosira sp. DedQUE10]|nr:hypothetical protein [Aulosira sp. DedQUE10]